MIVFKRGNIFESSADALVNPINCTPAMGRGLALQFRMRYHGLYEAHREAAARGRIRPGELTLFQVIEDVEERPRLIIGLPTKRDWRDLSRLEDVDLGLQALANLIEVKKIKSIAIPPLGCGLGGLRWEPVRDLIVQRLSYTAEESNAVVYVYAPMQVRNGRSW